MYDWLITSKEQIVVAFDVCSSTEIIEDLALTNRLPRWLGVLDELQSLLYVKEKAVPFIAYKFVGDGWILLFPRDSSGGDIIHFLQSLSSLFANRFEEYVKPALMKTPPKNPGLKFGVDVGITHRVRMLGAHEYIGRPLVTACRLQARIEDPETDPADKVLISEGCYQRYFSEMSDVRRYDPTPITRDLKGIAGGTDFSCVLLSFPMKDRLRPPFPLNYFFSIYPECAVQN